MGYIITKPTHSNPMNEWVEIKFYWPGTIEFNPYRKGINLFLSEKTHNYKIDYVKSLVEEFPKLFINVDFYTEEGINKVTLNISTEYNVEFK